ncbi:MAG TPA: ABC transporter ATP-binding protein [Thermomicrobiaceae bacterium]|nr:ABC transporter ATP-binding protein [Thermomicrobiaceae bacterium]
MVQQSEAPRVIARSDATPRLELAGVGKVFSGPSGPVEALRGVDLSVADGEFVAIVGPSGCGKSTILNVVAGLEQPTRGEVRLDGAALQDRLGRTAYMHQRDLLLPWRTVLDNAILGLEVAGVPRSEARARALALVERFGLTGFIDSYPAALSGGMRQRAAFLRTVLADRPILLLDEPFGALDALTRASMQEWLLGLWDELRRTILFITHDVEEAVLLADRVLVMSPRPGTIVERAVVGLPRPRRYEMVTEPAFVALKAALIAALRGDGGGVR